MQRENWTCKYHRQWAYSANETTVTVNVRYVVYVVSEWAHSRAHRTHSQKRKKISRNRKERKREFSNVIEICNMKCACFTQTIIIWQRPQAATCFSFIFSENREWKTKSAPVPDRVSERATEFYYFQLQSWFLYSWFSVHLNRHIHRCWVNCRKLILHGTRLL